MSEVSDHWYIRFPDGRVVRAINTTVVRQQVGAGRIPPNSSVRRSPDEEWTALEWTREFADLAAPRPAAVGPPRPAAPPDGAVGVSSRLDPTQFQTVGVRGMVHELLAALDTTLTRNKLAAAGVAGLACGLVLALAQLPPLDFEAGAPWARWLPAAAVVLVCATVAAALVTRMTFIEVSRLRPARWREARAGLVRVSVRLFVAVALTAGVAAALILLLRWLPELLLRQAGEGASAATVAAGAVAVVGMIVEVALWPVFGFALLLPPILVVEGCSVLKALEHWLRLLRQELGRVFLYEALALGLGAAATLLLALPLLALYARPPDPRLDQAMTFTRCVLTGLALAPLLAYAVVANVFIYLNLRYERGGRR
jgi:hypothetical protein